MNKTLIKLLTLIIMLPISADQRDSIDALLDGLHRDAHEGKFQTYFARYIPSAVFLGTDKTERWTIG